MCESYKGNPHEDPCDELLRKAAADAAVELMDAEVELDEATRIWHRADNRVKAVAPRARALADAYKYARRRGEE